MTEPVPETTGLNSAIGYAEAVATAHAAHGTNTALTTTLTAAEYGPAVLNAVITAQQASTAAAAAWTATAAALTEGLAVRDAYAAAPDAGAKHHLQADDAGTRDVTQTASNTTVNMAARYICRTSSAYPHTTGDGHPPGRKCRYCGAQLDIETGTWGVFDWTADNRYPSKNAKRTFIRRASAERHATTTDLVVRWIPDPTKVATR